MKKIIRSLFMLFVCSFLMITLSASTAKADGVDGAFDTSKNKVAINVTTEDIGNSTRKLILNVSVTYTKGFDRGTALYVICQKTAGVNTTFEDCRTQAGAIEKEFFSSGVGGDINGSTASYSPEKTGSAAEANPTTRIYKFDPNVTFTSTDKDKEYLVFVQVVFCSRRVLDANGLYQDTNSCQYFHVPAEGEEYYKTTFKVGDVYSGGTNFGEDPENEDIDNLMDKITEIVNNIVMPIIYIVLGLFLMVKGTILGVQIVKAADEPQVRSEKVGSLKWLVIGVAIAYAATGLVQVVTNFFSGAFSF